MTYEKTYEKRLDHQVIAGFIKPKSQVLDLGCGDGQLLYRLIKEKNIHGTGIEIDESAIYKCVEKGLTVSQGDIDRELAEYATKSFDYVILHESLQQVLHPEKVIMESLRVGKQVIVGIPNFCHYTARFQLFFLGHAPVTEELPYQWYDTPNLRFLSLKDFKEFCKKRGIVIDGKKTIGANSMVRFWPNFFAHIGIFLLHKD